MSDFVPLWPSGFDAWEGVAALCVLAFLKLTRACIMRRRASSIDRLGWSILTFDIVFGTASALAVLVALYPGLAGDLWTLRIATAAVIVVSLWQVTEVITAAPVRLESAMSGPANGYESNVETQDYTGPDRRQPGVFGRRDYDPTADPGLGQERM